MTAPNDEKRRTAPCIAYVRETGDGCTSDAPPKLRTVLPDTVAVRFAVTVDVPRIEGEAWGDTEARAGSVLKAVLGEHAELRAVAQGVFDAWNTAADTGGLEESGEAFALRFCRAVADDWLERARRALTDQAKKSQLED